MKKSIFKAFTLTLAVLIFGLAALSCGSSGKPAMTLGNQSISINMYEFFLSRQKGTLTTTYYYGSQAKSDDFWRTIMSSDGKTYNEFWTSYITEAARVYLAALYLFEEVYKLELPDSVIKSVDEKMDELVEYDGDGSKAALNAILSNYGVNHKMLREIYLLEEKINYLQEYLYGADLSKVADNVKEEFYQANYCRFKQVFIANYYYIYETDADGTVIYIDPETKTPVYDSKNGTRKFDGNGNAIKDENGSIIYYTEDGKIAYEKEKGEPMYTYDSNGKLMTKPYGADEMKIRLEKAEDITEFTTPGDTAAFEEYITKYSDEDSDVTYPNGYYFPVSAQYSYDYINAIITALSGMETGEVRIVQSDYGYHVVMKYKLDAGAYSVSENDVWFEDFGSMVAQWLFDKKCAEHTGSIVIDEDLLAALDMIKAKPNYNY